MRLALAQIDPTVGDLDGNRAIILERLDAAKEAGADVVVFPELAVTGYPPEDLLLRPGFIRAAERSLEQIAAAVHGIVAIVGAPHTEGGHLYNVAAVCADGEVKERVRKELLPNYGVFDEVRYFTPGTDLAPIEIGETKVGVTVCEDMWQPGPPASELARLGARLLINISASPFHIGKDRAREEMFRTRARDNNATVVFCNMVGGQDELLFDGHSCVIDERGEVIARAPGFEEALLVVDLDVPGPIAPFADELEQMRQALVLGLRDYVRKNGFEQVLVGVSGGIDSALTAAIAVEALGPDRVHCVSMPSRFSSEATRADARRLANDLDAGFQEIEIESVF